MCLWAVWFGQSLKMWMRSHASKLGTDVPCDIAFRTGPDEGATQLIYAHKDRLAARSAVFNSMFHGPLKESGNHVRVIDIDSSTFLEMLQ